MKEMINDISREMTNHLYTPPYNILFGRISESNQTMCKANKKELNSDFYDGFNLDS